MFHPNCEFFQDLDQWCPMSNEKTSHHYQTIDSLPTVSRNMLHTSISPQSWDYYHSISSANQAEIYNLMSVPPSFSNNVDGLANNTEFFDPFDFTEQNKVHFSEQSLVPSSLPVSMSPWQPQDSVDWQLCQTECTKSNRDVQYTIPLIRQESAHDIKKETFYKISRNEERSDVTLDAINSDSWRVVDQIQMETETNGSFWSQSDISLGHNYLELFGKENCRFQSWNSLSETTSHTSNHLAVTNEIKDGQFVSNGTDGYYVKSIQNMTTPNDGIYDSKDSNKIVITDTGHTPLKYFRKKPTIPIRNTTHPLKGFQELTRTHKSRSPESRDITIFPGHNTDDNCHTLRTRTYDTKYRELRDKNNEASKRSRMSRKSKELQMEKLAEQLEKRNEKLKMRAVVLEDLIKKLRETFMSAVSRKRVLNS